MASFHGRTASTRDDWQTPVELVATLGTFFLDPCANASDPTRLASFGFTAEQDGLATAWMGRVFVNPPYGRAARQWLVKLAAHGNGIALIPPRMGAAWFHDEVLAKADAILFLRGRIAFIDAATGLPVDGNNADSCLVAFGEMNADVLERCGLAGRVWRLK